MKKEFIFKLMAMLFIAALSNTAYAYDFKYGELCYNITGTDPNTVEVTYERFDLIDETSPNYPNLGGDVVIPETVYQDGKAYTVASIGRVAFYRCNLITSVSIPKTVKKIDIDALRKCDLSKGVTFAEGSSLTEIGDYVFCFTNLESITLPNSITSMGEHLFESCKSLKSANIPTGISTIPTQTFSGCTALTSFDIPGHVTTIGRYAFTVCTNLKSVTFPNSLQIIDEGAFKGCTSLTDITFPQNLYLINKSAFSTCTGLTSVTIPYTVTAGEYAFTGCTGLTSVVINNDTFGKYQFSRCTALKSITIADKMFNIKPASEIDPFSGCNAIEILNIDSNKAVDVAYFSDSKGSIQTVTLGSNVTIIPENAFIDCTALKTVTIPSDITSIGNSAFKGCSAMRDFYSKMERPLAIDASVFEGVQQHGYCDLHVPAGSKVRYEAMEVWKEFTIITEDGGAPANRYDLNGDGKISTADIQVIINEMKK